MSNLDEISESFYAAKKFGIKDITLLYCVSNYPSKVEDFNLNNIKILKNKFNCRIGLSDHSKDNKIAMAAIAAGAEVVEKHIALQNQKNGLDIKFSLKGKEIKKFKNDLIFASKLLGKNYFYRNNSEKKSNIFKRSIFIVKNVKKGEKFTKNNLRRIRPGYGLKPIYYPIILNKKSNFNIEAGEPFLKKFLRFKN